MEGYRVKEYGMPVKRYCQALDLKNNPELIAEYRKIHSREKAWPEIRAGIRSVGILEMEIYISDSHLVMVVDTPIDFDWDSSMSKLAKLPRQEEWEELVGKFQHCCATATSNEKWQMMDRMFYLYN